MVLNMKPVVLEKPVVAQLVSNLTTYITRRPVTVFTTVAPSYYFFKIRLKRLFPSALRSPKLISSFPGFRLKSCGVLSLSCVLHIPQISLFLVTPRFGSFTLGAENSRIRCTEGSGCKQSQTPRWFRLPASHACCSGCHVILALCRRDCSE